ncbi:MAG: arginine--tRNA ligase [candidate division WOR-3 bacterium]|nr:MAG: arginine--tRNA ligase [candidate division WOR-3 bacterium]
MIREDLRRILKKEYPEEDIVIDYVPKEKEGDYYTNLAFKIASREGAKPDEVANMIARQIQDPIIKRITVHPPAFINFTLNEEYLYEQMSKDRILDIGEGKRILVEFVSANPTGPINIVSARAAAVGDSLVRMLKKAGFNAYAEYYVNDAGKQAALLAESVRQRKIEISGGEAHIPENGYHGEYVKEIAVEVIARGLENQDDIKKYSIEYFIKDHQRVMRRFGVEFDVWTLESDLYRQKYVDKALGLLKEKNLTYTEEGALFFRTTTFGDDKDRVIVTSDQRNTYLLPDIAYHLNKLERNYDQLIDIWGPDHHGRIKGILGGIQALGFSADVLRIMIVQEVKIKEHGKLMTMSKRAGTFASLSDLLEKIPIDVARFFFLMRSSSQHLDFDLDLALKQSDENPVYYVQYAYARIKSIIRFAAQKGIDLPEKPNASLLKQEEEFDLMKDILKYTEVLSDAVHNLEPYMITYYLIELARDFHSFYQKHRVVTDDTQLTQSRLYLISRTAQTIKDGLELLGVSCPEEM